MELIREFLENVLDSGIVILLLYKNNLNFPLIISKNHPSQYSNPSLLVQITGSSKQPDRYPSFQFSGTLVFPGESIHSLGIRPLNKQSSKLKKEKQKCCQCIIRNNREEPLPSPPLGSLVCVVGYERNDTI